MMKKIFIVLILFGMVLPCVAADTSKGMTELPTDSVSLVSTDDSKFTVYKDTEKTIEKTQLKDIWLFDATAKIATLISASDTGVAGDSWSDHPTISLDGKLAAFHSWSTNLVASPFCANVFLKEIDTDRVTMVKDHALSPSMSSDGMYIVYEYNADPENGLPAIYRYEVSTGKEEFIDYTSYGNRVGGWYFPNPKISDKGDVITYHTTKSGKPEVWQWSDGKLLKVNDGTVVDEKSLEDEKPIEELDGKI